ncbi:hypothetical protein Tco_0948352 [Tanacetum coccineum]
MPMDDLLQAVPKLISRIDSLELDLKQTKLTMGNAIVKLVKKVKKLEGFLKEEKFGLTRFIDEEPEAQGGTCQDDPQDSSIQRTSTPPTTRLPPLKQGPLTREGDTREEKRTKSKNSLKLGLQEVDAVRAGEDKGQREGKLPMLSERNSKEVNGTNYLTEEASLKEAIKDWIPYKKKRG